ncbi:predicted protein [Sclerotinia sclerotiorum 1980 UF-70]|uniref:Uncharacterized protein n=1 Tax=Sclerotinia sclerotiorum (strain ATCC 18683 / 1980 / Ss-1) TaxID=665079 RepID=A7EKG7_SCLS1|nr:predicted protein [Sclerotinia sclerotiorum 1980 UF-70]EDO03333.1 predicted protein [Sclerotinia sclerotiorum 1980 UF-70]
MEQRSSHVPDSDGEIQQQPSAPSTRRLVIEIPSRPRAFEPKKRPNPKGSDQDDEELSGAEQNPAKRRKKDHIGQDISKDHNPPEGDDDSSDDPFLDEPKGNKGKGKATGYHLEQPEQVPDEDGDVVFDDLWTLDDESNLLMSWSEDDQTLLDSLPKAEIALWRRLMRLFGVGPEELFLPNVTISRADLPDYVGKDGRAIPNKIHLSTNFCNAFKYGDRCAVPKSFDTQVIDMEATSLLETLRHAGIIGNLTCGQERIFKDILGDRFPEHFHFHEHLKDIVKANSGMKPQNASKNPDAERGRFSSPNQIWKKDWVLSQRRQQLRSEKQPNLRDPLGGEILEDNNLSDDAEDSGFDLAHGGRISSDEENQEDDQAMIDDEPFGMGMVSGERSPVLTGPQEAQRIEPFEVLASPKGENLPNVPAPDEARDSESIPGFQNIVVNQSAISKCDIQQYRDDKDNTLVRRSNMPMAKDSIGNMVQRRSTQLKMLETQAYAYLSK